jgi:hypothetical protein
VAERYNVCLVQPESYLHSGAFLELAELLHYALIDLGFSSRLSVNRLDAFGRNIVIGAHLFSAQAIARLPQSTIILNTEQLGSREHPWTDVMLNLARRFVMWDYSAANIAFFEGERVAGVRLLKLGFQRQLARLKPVSDPDIDVLFYGSIGERRQSVIDALLARGVTVRVLFGTYGRQRDQEIERAKLVLNCHHYDRHIFEVVRVFYLLCNRIPVVAEIGPNTEVEPEFRSAVAATAYEELADQCLRLLNDEAARAAVAERGYAVINQRPQSELIRSLVVT